MKTKKGCGNIAICKRTGYSFDCGSRCGCNLKEVHLCENCEPQDDTTNKEYDKTVICPISKKKGYVKEEDCHCFCCGTHKPKNHSQQDSSKFKDAFPNQDFWSRPTGTNANPLKGIKPTDFNLKEERKIIINVLLDNFDVLGLEFCNFIIGLIKQQDKEFIQRLKRRYCCQTYIGKYCNKCDDCNFINKLSGGLDE